jgi:hypothetical protein
MKKQILLATGLISALVLVGCSQQPTTHKNVAASVVKPAQEVHQTIYQEIKKPQVVTPVVIKKPAEAAVKPNPVQPKLIKITGIGYGAASTYEGFTPGQRRLMAIRSSKLDAYRALAEQLFGVKIDSNTTVSTLMAKNDNFRARVNAVVKGARVVSITPMPDNNYETVLEVYIDESFFKNAFVYSACTSGNCDSKPIDLSQICSSGANCRTLGR